MKKKLLIFWLILLFFNCTQAIDAVTIKQFLNSADWNFIENKGQLNNDLSKVKYYGRQGGVELYCWPGGISFVFTKKIRDEQVSEASGKAVNANKGINNRSLTLGNEEHTAMQFCQARLVFIHANLQARIIASEKQDYYENYYLSRIRWPDHDDQGITYAQTYKTVTYKNIYPHIDLVLLCHDRGMKYEFVVYPGGRASDIQMQWQGLENSSITSWGGISYSLPLGKISEGKPVCYQGKKNAAIESSFYKKDNAICFHVSGYDRSKPLIIDPVLEWGTYFGGEAFEYSLGTIADSMGNVYITGYTASKSGIATAGSYQSSFSGAGFYEYDAFIAKFDRYGHTQWSTYFGGDSGIMAYDIALGRHNDLFITGATTSGNIATKGAYQTSRAGYDEDAFLARFNSNGILQWSTYYGGSNLDQAFGVAVDAGNNVFITGWTESASGIATKGAYQVSLQQGTKYPQDAFLAKFNESGDIQWSTYYGGEGLEEGKHVHVEFQNVYVVGYTFSTTGIATKGAYQTAYASQGKISGDAFVAKFTADGQMEWATYFGGDSVDDATSVVTDLQNNVYISGYTASKTGIASAGAYQTSLAGDYNTFLAKFNTNGSLEWATYYGGDSSTFGDGMATDPSGYILVCGGTASAKGIATSGAFTSTLDGKYNPFLSRFSPDGKLVWGSYFASDGGAYSICTDAFGDVFVSGGTNSTRGIATAGAWHSAYSGGPDDAFLVSFNLKAAHDAGASFPGSSVSVCRNAQQLNMVLHNYGFLPMDSVFIGWSIDGKMQPLHRWTGKLLPDSDTKTVLAVGTPLSVGNYTVKAWTFLPNGVTDSLNANDTSIVALTIMPLPAADAGEDKYLVCKGTHTRIGTKAINGMSYLWTSIPSGFSSTLSNPVVNPIQNTVYYLQVTDMNTGCTNMDSTKVSVQNLPAPVADAGNDQSICKGDSVRIGSAAQKLNTYSWTSSPAGFVSSKADPVVAPSSTTTYYLEVENINGCTDIDSVTVTVSPMPHANAGASQGICAGTAVQLGAAPNAGHTYYWTSKPAGFNSSISNPVDTPQQTTRYYLRENISATGCSDSDSVLITVVPKPVVAFSLTNTEGFAYQFNVKKPNYPASLYHWNFGEEKGNANDTASGYSVRHSYSKNGQYRVSLTVETGYCTLTDTASVDIEEKFWLKIFPNPFVMQTDINYLLVDPDHVRIAIADETGREIGTLVDAQLAPGEYHTPLSSEHWNTAAGVYFVTFQAGNKLIKKKVVQVY